MNIEIIKELFNYLNQKVKIAGLSEYELILKNQEIQNLIYRKYIKDISIGNTLDFDSSRIQETISKNHAVLEKIINLYSSNTYWSKNWSFYPFSKQYSAQLGQFLLFKGGEYRLIKPGEFIVNNINGNEELVNIKIKELELVTQSDGGKWLVVNGKNILGENSILRIYFNFNYADFDSLCVLVTRLTEELNNRFISFKLKIAPLDFQRSDTGVLYFHRSQMFVVFYVINKLFNPTEELKKTTLLKKLLSKINLFNSRKMAKTYFNPADSLNQSTPLFTKPLIENLGIGFAEEIDGSVFSFGQFVSKKITSLFLKTGGEFIEDIIIKELEKDGANVNELFRNDFTKYPYDFSIFDKPSNEISFSNNKNKFTSLKFALYFGRNILKNCIYFTNNSKTEIKWQSARFDEKLDIYYELIDDSFESGRLGIIYFLYRLFVFFPEELIFMQTIELVLKNLIRNDNDELDSKCYDFLNSKIENPNSNMTFEYEIGMENSTNFLYNYKKFQVVSNLKNNVFVPTIKDGYAGFGLKLLQDKYLKINNISEYFREFLIDDDDKN